MTPTSLKHIKEDMKRFLPVVTSIANYFESQPSYKLLEVLIQNVAFDGSNCQGYSYSDEVKKLQEIELLVKTLAEYSQSYVEQYIYNELSFSILGSQYEEEY